MTPYPIEINKCVNKVTIVRTLGLHYFDSFSSPPFYLPYKHIVGVFYLPTAVCSGSLDRAINKTKFLFS